MKNALGIIDQVKAATSQKAIQAILKNASGFQHISARTLAKVTRIGNKKLAILQKKAASKSAKVSA